MTYERFKDVNFKPARLKLIKQCNEIIERFMRQGYTMSVRQLYYQLVAADMIENTLQSYKRLAEAVSEARMAGLMRWDAIEDRGRDFIERTRWTSPRQIIQASHDSFHMDMWVNQDTRVIVIVEKAALSGVLDPACRKYDVPLLAARGYPSISVMYEMAIERVVPALDEGKDVVILHMGDHDPSGIDMTRDLDEKLQLFTRSYDYDNLVKIERIALTMDQIDEQRPPPNPAKSTDSRFNGYYDLYGDKSWELDALQPSFIDNLVSAHIEMYRDEHAWDARSKLVKELREEIGKLIFKVSDEDDIYQKSLRDSGDNT